MRIRFQCVVPLDKFGPSGRMRKSFLLISGDGEDGAVPLVTRAGLLFRLSSSKNSGETVYIFPLYKDGTPALDKVDKELGSVCVRWSTTDKEGYSGVAGDQLVIRTELNSGE